MFDTLIFLVLNLFYPTFFGPRFKKNSLTKFFLSKILWPFWLNCLLPTILLFSIFFWNPKSFLKMYLDQQLFYFEFIRTENYCQAQFQLASLVTSWTEISLMFDYYHPQPPSPTHPRESRDPACNWPYMASGYLVDSLPGDFWWQGVVSS